MRISDWSSDGCSSDLPALVAQVLHVGQQLQGAVTIPQGVQGHHQLAGLRPGDPGVLADAADAESFFHEGVPVLGDEVEARVTADCAAQERVVPVHRELGLVEELVGVLTDRVGEPATGQLPLGLRVVRSEEDTSELQSIMRRSYGVSCLNTKKT